MMHYTKPRQVVIKTTSQDFFRVASLLNLQGSLCMPSNDFKRIESSLRRVRDGISMERLLNGDVLLKRKVGTNLSVYLR